jgi:anhydro-N-acetylmuramic acid kinase
VPAADAALLPAIGGWRAVLNLGGIANLTLLPPATGPDRHQNVRGWDCGPANTLLDLAVGRFSDGSLGFDADGAWARRGQVQEQLINRWLAEPYFRQPPPKSTGRESFGAADLERRLGELAAARMSPWGPAADADAAALAFSPNAGASDAGVADALATLTAFTAAVVAADLERGPRPVELLVAGGGSRNGFLMEQLRRRCRGFAVRPLEELGIGSAEREALAFALLAWWHQLGHPGSMPAVTGASGASVLGICAPTPGNEGLRPR